MQKIAFGEHLPKNSKAVVTSGGVGLTLVDIVVGVIMGYNTSKDGDRLCLTKSFH